MIHCGFLKEVAPPEYVEEYCRTVCKLRKLEKKHSWLETLLDSKEYLLIQGTLYEIQDEEIDDSSDYITRCSPGIYLYLTREKENLKEALENNLIKLQENEHRSDF